jgi:lysophospholipase L1-like esterase
MANSLGQLMVRLGLDAADFTSGLTKSEYQAQKFASSLSNNIAIGVAKAEIALEALKKVLEFTFEAVPHLIEQAGHFQDIAEKAGGAAEKWASFAVAAKIGGTEMDAVASASIKLSAGLSKVDDQSKGAGLALKAIGIGLKDIQGVDPATQIEMIAKKLAEFEDGAGKTAVAVALFGKAGAEMLPFLKELGEGVGRVTILTAEDIKQADEWADHHAKAKAKMNEYAQVLAIQLIPSLTAVTEATSEVIKQLLNLDGAGDELKAGRAILDWAEQCALAIAAVGDVALVIVRSIRALTGSFDELVAHVEVAKKFSYRSFFTEDGKREFDAALRERERSVIEANKRIEALNGSATPVTDAVTKAFQHQKRLIDDPEYAREFARMNDAGKGAKKKLSGAGLLNDDAAKDADQAARKRLEGQVRAVRDFAEQQKAGYEFANQYLKGVYDSGVLSLAEFFADQKALREANLQSQLTALDAEIKLQEDYKARALKPAERVEAEQKIADARRKRADIVQDAARKEILAEQDAERQFKQTAYAYYDFLAQQANLKGDTATASSLRIAKQVQEAQELLTKLHFDPAQVQAQSEAYGELLRKTDELARVQTDYGRLVEHAGNQEKLAQLAAQESGAGELETLTRIASVRQEALASMTVLVERARQLAQELGTPEAQQFADRLTVQLRQAAAAADPVLQKVREIGREIGDNFGNAIEDAVFAKGKSIRDRVLGVFDGLATDISKALLRQNVTKPLADWMTNLLGGNGMASGGGGLLGQIFGLAGNRSSSAAMSNTAQESFRVSEILKENLDTSGVVSSIASQVTATATATASMATLAAAAQAAAAALGMVASSGGGAGGLGGLFGLLGGGSQAAFSQTALGSSGFGTGLAYGALDLGGFLATGGPALPGTTYGINERGAPEVLDVNGRQFLMMGAQRGQVIPLQGSSGGGTNLYVTVTPPPGGSRQTAVQWGAEAGRHIQAALRRNGK